MAHNININNGKESFVSTERAWHKLGTILPNRFTAKEAIEYANLDYKVEKTEIYKKDNDNLTIVPNHFATYRTDNNEILGVVGSRYEIVQNIEAFKFFDAIVGEGQAIFETAGVLGKGERIFITAKLPGDIKIAQKDAIEKFLLFTSSHDGSGAITAMFTPIRVVCENTLLMALSKGNQKVHIKHTKNAGESLKDAYKVLDISSRLSNDMQNKLNYLTTVKITDEQLKKYITSVVLPKVEIGTKEDVEISTRSLNVIDSILSYYDNGRGQELEHCRGTLYGAYNAITGYIQNQKEYKTAEDKMNNIFFGSGFEMSTKAYNEALIFNNL